MDVSISKKIFVKEEDNIEKYKFKLGEQSYQQIFSK